MVEGPQFAHEDLDRSLSQIRIISVSPEAEGPIYCTIKHVDLDAESTPNYRALSYTWGLPSPTHEILLNGRSLTIRWNLYEFLLAFRKRLHTFRGGETYEDEEQWLWIDQIYIDQSVVEERNHQVRMMSRIYTQATYVYVWLGASNEQTETAIRVIKTGLRRYRYDNYAVAVKKKRRSTLKKDAEDSDADAVEALESFFGNSYWKRLWIVQEVMLARYIRVICGDTLLSWEELRRFCLSDLASLPTAQSVSVPNQTVWLAEHAFSGKSYGLKQLLDTFGQSHCKDLRDKVFGLQGLLIEEDQIWVDYGRSIKEVYYDAAYIICNGPRVLSPWGPDSLYRHIDFCGELEPRNSFVEAELKNWQNSVRTTYRELVADINGSLLAQPEDRVAIWWWSPFKNQLSYMIESRTRKITTTAWNLDLFFSKRFKFHNDDQACLEEGLWKHTFRLSRTTNWSLHGSVDTELEMRLQACGYDAGIHEVRVMLKETSSGELSMTVRVVTCTVPRQLSHPWYFNFNIDLNDERLKGDYDCGTSVVFTRERPLQNHAEAFLEHDPELCANTFCDLGDERLKHVWTGRSERDRPADWTIREETKFWRATAVGFRQ